MRITVENFEWRIVLANREAYIEFLGYDGRPRVAVLIPQDVFPTLLRYIEYVSKWNLGL
jgi:hypothetical protein